MTFSNIDFDELIIVPASSICESIFDGTHDSPKQQDYGFKLVTSRHIKANKVLSEEAYFINEEDYTKINKRSRLQIGDVLFTMIGTVGEVCRLSVEPDFAIKNIGVFRPAEASDSVWIYYYLLSPEGRKNIEAAKRGTTQQFMGLKELREFPVNFPKDSLYRHNQMQILELIDSKIDSNYALSKTLEDIAQTIFKSWFIDFDPVKAKMAGEKPAGMDAATAALFPHSMEESELGLIPQGWSISKLGEYLNVTKGKSYKSSELEPSKIALVTLKSFKRGGGYRFDGLKPYSGDYKPEQIVEPGDLIVSFTDVTQAADVIGKPAIVVSNPKFSTLVASLDVGIVRTTGSNLGKNYLYQLFSTAMFKNHIDGYTNGTTVLHLGKNALEDFTVPLPDARLMSIFESLGSSVIDKLQAIYLENLSLEQIRDSLLPRLISGELQIPDEMLAS
jgi:type I restriction enzyme S subunit